MLEGCLNLQAYRFFAMKRWKYFKRNFSNILFLYPLEPNSKDVSNRNKYTSLHFFPSIVYITASCSICLPNLFKNDVMCYRVAVADLNNIKPLTTAQMHRKFRIVFFALLTWAAMELWWLRSLSIDFSCIKDFDQCRHNRVKSTAKASPIS